MLQANSVPFITTFEGLNLASEMELKLQDMISDDEREAAKYTTWKDLCQSMGQEGMEAFIKTFEGTNETVWDYLESNKVALMSNLRGIETMHPVVICQSIVNQLANIVSDRTSIEY